MIGVVVSEEGPSTRVVEFVVVGDTPVHQGQYVAMDYSEGTLIALVEDVKKTNRYFEHVETVKEYYSTTTMDTQFPVNEWEFTLAVSKPLLVIKDGTIKRPTYPPPPGTSVYVPSSELLFKVLNFKENGINIGAVQFHDVPVKLGVSETFQKHLAILAMSGAGKSYLTTVIIEELLKRSKEDGRLAVVLFDVHGEYTGFADASSPFKTQTQIFNDVKISVPNLTEGMLVSMFQSEASGIQRRELSNVIKAMKSRNGYDLNDMIEYLYSNRSIHEKTRQALISSLINLNETGLFASYEKPALQSVVKPGTLSIFNLHDVIGERKRVLIVTYVLNRLFELRRSGKIPPTVVIIEEAHNFAPEGKSVKDVPSKSIIDTIAREGRKFGLSLVLISQRPVKLSTTALSQCNTQIILRITNPRDLNHISESAEAIDRRSLEMLTSLTPGEALVIGAAVRMPVFIKVRKKVTPEGRYEKSLEEMAIEWELSTDELEKEADQL